MELMIRIVDRSPAIDDSKSGDVICANPDGWAWSKTELLNPEYVIISTNITQSEVEALLSNDNHLATMTQKKPRRKYSITQPFLKSWPPKIDKIPAPLFRKMFNLK